MKEIFMQETLSRADAESVGSPNATEIQRKSRWTRTHTIWLLMILSLLPGAVIALDREAWTELAAGMRAAVYLVSAALIAAACWLILRKEDKQT
jgi:SNF family Na+-dependent transporter